MLIFFGNLAYDIRPYCFNSQESWDKDKEMATWQVHKWSTCLIFFLFLGLKAVNVEIKDGRIVAIHHVEMPLPLSDSQIDVSLLASAASPVASVSQNLTVIFDESSVLASDWRISFEEFSFLLMYPVFDLLVRHIKALYWNITVLIIYTPIRESMEYNCSSFVCTEITYVDTMKGEKKNMNHVWLISLISIP